MTESKVPLYLMAFFALAFFAWGVVNLDEYGLTHDEAFHVRRGMYALQFNQELFRAPSYAAMVAKAETLKTAFPADFAHPTFFPMIHVFLAQHVGVDLLGLEVLEARHLFILLVSTLGLLGLFLLVQQSFNGWVALFSVFVLGTFPHFVANAQYNPKDVPVMAAGIFAVLAFLMLLKAPTWGRLLLLSLATAAAIGTKLDAVFLLPVYGAASFLWLQQGPTLSSGQRLGVADWPKLALVFSLLTLVILVLMWPLLIVKLSTFVEATTRFTAHYERYRVFLFGERFISNQTPWYFLPAYLVVMTPLPLMLFFGTGLVLWLGRWREKFTAVDLTILLWAVLPIAVRLLPGVNRYDTIRHIIFALPPLAIISGLGLYQIVLLLRSAVASRYRQLAAAGAVALWLALALAENWQFHPFQESYYNQITVRAFRGEMAKSFDLDYWGSSYRHVVRWLNANAPQDSNIVVPAAPFVAVLKAYPLREDLTVEAKTSLGAGDLFVAGPRMQHFCGAAKKLCDGDPEVLTKLHSRKVADIEIFAVYGPKAVGGLSMRWP